MADQYSKLRQEWLELAPYRIKESREGGDVAGLRILDCGCGEGRFCRMLAERGAQYVLGVDTCEPMIAAARELQSDNDQYMVGDVQNLDFLADQSFDLAISYLNQCDLPDFEANIREVYRVLTQEGRFIVANLHPMRTAEGSWYRAPDGTKLHVILDHYFDEGERHFVMKGVEITNFHRMLSTYIRAFLKAGFVLEDIIEPTAAPEALALYPELDDELRVPNFIIYVLRK